MSFTRGLLNPNTGNRTIQQRQLNNFKWSPGESELSLEDKMEQFVPRTAKKKKLLKAYMDKQIVDHERPFDKLEPSKQSELIAQFEKVNNRTVNADREDDIDEVAAWWNKKRRAATFSWNFLETQMKLNDAEATIDADFVKGFWNWLMGNGTEDEVAKTPWGRTAPYWDAEVKEYILNIVNAYFDFRESIYKLAVAGRIGTINGIDMYALYYKYIVHGDGGERPPDDYLDDFMDGWLEATRLRQESIQHWGGEKEAAEQNYKTTKDLHMPSPDTITEDLGVKMMAPLLITDAFYEGNIFETPVFDELGVGQNQDLIINYNTNYQITWKYGAKTYIIEHTPQGLGMGIYETVTPNSETNQNFQHETRPTDEEGGSPSESSQLIDRRAARNAGNAVQNVVNGQMSGDFDHPDKVDEPDSNKSPELSPEKTQIIAQNDSVPDQVGVEPLSPNTSSPVPPPIDKPADQEVPVLPKVQLRDPTPQQENKENQATNDNAVEEDEEEEHTLIRVQHKVVPQTEVHKVQPSPSAIPRPDPEVFEKKQFDKFLNTLDAPTPDVLAQIESQKRGEDRTPSPEKSSKHPIFSIATMPKTPGPNNNITPPRAASPEDPNATQYLSPEQSPIAASAQTQNNNNNNFFPTPADGSNSQGMAELKKLTQIIFRNYSQTQHYNQSPGKNLIVSPGQIQQPEEAITDLLKNVMVDYEWSRGEINAVVGNMKKDIINCYHTAKTVKGRLDAMARIRDQYKPEVDRVFLNAREIGAKFDAIGFPEIDGPSHPSLGELDENHHIIYRDPSQLSEDEMGVRALGEDIMVKYLNYRGALNSKNPFIFSDAPGTAIAYSMIEFISDVIDKHPKYFKDDRIILRTIPQMHKIFVNAGISYQQGLEDISDAKRVTIRRLQAGAITDLIEQLANNKTNEGPRLTADSIFHEMLVSVRDSIYTTVMVNNNYVFDKQPVAVVYAKFMASQYKIMIATTIQQQYFKKLLGYKNYVDFE